MINSTQGSNRPRFRERLAALINEYSLENGSNTPDFIIADYLIECLRTYNKTVKARDRFFSFKPFKNSMILEPRLEIAIDGSFVDMNTGERYISDDNGLTYRKETSLES